MTTNSWQRGGRMALIAAATVFLFAGTSQAADVTGKWCNGDATFAVRQVGDQVWWVAKSKGDGGKSFTSVFHGKLVGKQLTGDFADMPDGDIRYQGSQTARVITRNGEVVEIKGKVTPFAGLR